MYTDPNEARNTSVYGEDIDTEAMNGSTQRMVEPDKLLDLYE